MRIRNQLLIYAALVALITVAASCNSIQRTRTTQYKMTTRIPPHKAVWDFTGEEIDAFWKF